MFYTFSLLSIRAGMQEVDKKSLKYVSGKCEKTALCYLKKYFSSRNNNIGPVRFQLILLDTLFGRELSMFHIYLAVIFFISLCFILKGNCLNFLQKYQCEM